MIWWYDDTMIWWYDVVTVCHVMVWWYDNVMTWRWYDGVRIWTSRDMVIWWHDDMITWWYDDMMIWWYEDTMWYDVIWRCDDMRFHNECNSCRIVWVPRWSHIYIYIYPRYIYIYVIRILDLEPKETTLHPCRTRVFWPIYEALEMHRCIREVIGNQSPRFL